MYAHLSSYFGKIFSFLKKLNAPVSGINPTITFVKPSDLFQCLKNENKSGIHLYSEI